MTVHDPRWVDWQRKHAEALAALQETQRAYHRTIAGRAFTTPTDNLSSGEIQKEALEALEAARLHLDEVRARRPNTC